MWAWVQVGTIIKGGQFIIMKTLSVIKQPLKFHLPFPYKIYTGEYGLETEGKSLSFVHTILLFHLSSLTIMPNLIYYLGQR